MDQESGSEFRGNLTIEIRRTAKGEYSYDTRASFSGPLDDEADRNRMLEVVGMNLRDADGIARNEITLRWSLDQRGLSS